MDKNNSKMHLALWLTVIGAVLGGVLTCWLAPKMITWYFTPPAQIGFNCAEPISWALEKMQVALVVGILLGSGAGIAAFFGLFNRGAKAAPSAPS